ncbi:helix-turn-helix domain-containing protein [Kitasatospora kifunensis]|uniref:Transcriptional regulator with XRE-family HTH domain n=1 Tax=Kitasatospora kifunensis TaxID=58351 RepID=A0A7W7QYE9_KITKI|nr:helix-turn-helix domain-containing protein [Kitasatospora kifunensis]MBB4921446.1 transcriptional regulator with XRE-family HTH domain [Kitasatospora kifunensis]
MNVQAPSAGLGALLRSARRGAGLTQEQLAGLSTISVRAIRDLEQGRVQHPRKDTIRLLADTMRLSGTHRATLELAIDSTSVGSTLRNLYGVELAPPPAPLRPLAGRRPELRALTGLLAAEHERLLTVVGLPGVGKSRLAQEAALHFHAGAQTPVLWVAMDRTAEEQTGARHRPQSALVSWVRSLISQGGNVDELAAVVREKPTLLVLDGYDAPHGGAGSGLLSLLNSCERLKVLITSRRPQQALDGRLLPLAPLPVPEAVGPEPTRAEQVGSESVGPFHPFHPLTSAPVRPPCDASPAERPAVDLMLSYVSHLRPDLLPTESVVATVTRICHALDGLPQALEAAGSWLLLYSPEQLLEIVRSTPLALIDGAAPPLPGSGPALSGLLADTVRDLNPRLARLLRAVAPLTRPWTVDAAARTLGLPPTAAARDVHALLLHGLLRQLPAAAGPVGGPARFTVLNLVRQLVPCQATFAPSRRPAQRAMPTADTPAPAHVLV